MQGNKNVQSEHNIIIGYLLGNKISLCFLVRTTYNMKTIEFKNWEEFQKTLDFSSPVEKSRKPFLPPSEIVYRGQSNAEWPLETTLQRLENKVQYGNFNFVSYVKTSLALSDSINSLTGSDWNLWPISILIKDYGDLLSGNLRGVGKNILEYLIYLRHCGFPSPLLDWTESPYVAAFFAFCEIPDNAQKVAIYSFQEMPMGSKYIDYDGRAEIRVIDYSLKTHRRHYLQQVQYTICLQQFGETQGFGKYEDAIAASSEYEDVKTEDKPFCQDLLIKYTIPATERTKVLRHLDKMNISYASLFGTEDALIKTLAMRELELWKE